jgi:pimeloyl-ACP methyl ester carboxylesterase/DNA-binding SARP family transcriptional activator/class 3 adenylate cyclase/tetratricopeptide (TPR) repeat protein
MSVRPQPLTISVLGDFRVVKGGQVCELPPSRKTKALLAYLAVTARPQRRERLCEIFWDLPDDPRGSLRWSLSKIRSILKSDGDDPLEADRNSVLLRPNAIETDYSTVMNLGPAQFDHLPLDRMETLAGLFRGRFLEDLSMPNCHEYEAWRVSHSDILELTARRLFRALVDRLRNTPEQAMIFLHELQRLDPEDQNLVQEAEEFAEAARRMVAGGIAGSAHVHIQADPAETASAMETPADQPDETATPASMDSRAGIAFCTTRDGIKLAYAQSGAGPPLVRAAHWMSHLSYDEESPIWRHWIQSLQSEYSFLRYDERCNGLSDWVAEDVSFEAMITDLEAVVDAAGLDRFTLLGVSQSCAVSIAYAVRHPHRVSGLVLYGGYARGWRKRADAREIALREALATLMREGWGRDNPIFRQLFAQRFVPGATAEQLSWFNELQRRTVSPENAWRLQSMAGDIDVTALLPHVKVPTLVIHGRGDLISPFECGKEFAAAIPGAQFVPLESENHILLSHEPAFEAFVRALRIFTDDIRRRPAPRPAAVESRRLVTVVAVDILHPLDAVEDVDPEKTARTIAPLVAEAARIMVEHGGFLVSRHQSDLTCVFGAHVPMEDFARQACLAALAVRTAIESGGDHLARARIALDTGEVIVHSLPDGPEGLGSVSGSPVRSVWRTIHTMRQSTIAATRKTRDAAGGYIETRQMPRSGFTSLPRGQHFFEVIAARRAATRWQLRADRTLTRLVGRETELALLRDVWRRVQSGHGKAVAIMGDPGIGKSRLCYEFLDREMSDTVRVAQGGALESDAGMALGLVQKLLKSLCGIPDGSPAREVAEALARLVSDVDADPRMLSPLSYLCGIPVDDDVAWNSLPVSDQTHRAGEAFRNIIMLAARKQPLVALVEDLHWADPESQSILKRAIENIEPHAILYLLTARSTTKLALDQAGSLSVIRLDPLETSAAETLALELLGDDSQLRELARHLAIHTSGTPLFLEETVWMLRQSGRLSAMDFSLPNFADGQDIPATVQSMIAARLNGLSASDREILKAASIIGMDFPVAILRDVVPLSQGEFESALHRLRESHFVVELRSFPATVYGFRHELVRAVALRGLLMERRKLLHERVLRVIGSLHPDYAREHAERMCEHALQAEAWTEAVGYLMQAADRALKRSANQAALSYADQALRALEEWPHGPQRHRAELDIQKLRGVAWMGVKGWSAGEVIEACERVEALCDELGDETELFTALRGRSQYYMMCGEPQRSLNTLSRCLDLENGPPKRERDLEGHHLYWTNAFFMGNHCLAAEHTQKAMGVYDPAVDHHLTYKYSGHDPGACCHMFAGMTAALQAQPCAAVRHCEHAVRLAADLSHAMTNALAYWGLGLTQMLLGNPEPAMDATCRSIEICREYQTPLMLGVTTFQKGWADFALGNRLDGLREMEDGLAAIRATGAGLGLPYFMAIYGDACSCCGRHDSGLATVEQAVARARETGALLQLPEMIVIRSDILQRQGALDAQEKERSLREALEVARSQEAGTMVLRIVNRIAAHHAETGKKSEAAALVAEHAGLITSMHGSREAALAQSFI